MLIPSFNFSLARPVQSGLVVLGKFDGKHPSIALATAGDSVMVHSPHKRSETMEHEVRELSINKNITALSCGDMKIDHDDFKNKDLLFVGTSDNIMAYNMEDNQDVFYKEIPDGVSKLAFGLLPGMKAPLAIVGGNCSIQGFDSTGMELFWTVTGEKVSSFTMRNRNNINELLVGSEDLHIRVFHAEEVVSEICESDTCIALTNIEDKQDMFGFGLANNTIGVYKDTTRVWSEKGRDEVVDVLSYDLDADGVAELCVAWSSGLFQVRNIDDGKVVYEDKLNSGIAKLVKGDYRMDSNEQIIACSVDGDLRGYMQADEEKKGNLMDKDVDAELLAQLQAKKATLMAELASFEENTKNIKSGNTSNALIPSDTKLLFSVAPNYADHAISLLLTTNNDTLIRFVTVYSEAMYEEQSQVIFPSAPEKELEIALVPPKNISIDLAIKAVIGYIASPQDHVFEMAYTIPPFGSFFYTPRLNKKIPTSFVKFYTNERVNRVLLWMTNRFSVEFKNPLPSQASLPLKVQFQSVIDETQLVINITSSDSKLHCIEIRTDNLGLAGDLIQDMASYLQIVELESTGVFKEEMDAFKTVLEQVSEYNSIRTQLTAGIADRTQLLKLYVMKAEDLRQLGDIAAMNAIYAQLYNLNLELIGEFQKRANNRNMLNTKLKEVNGMIQKASRLRMGKAKQRTVALFRKGVISNNSDDIINVIQTGNVGATI